MPRAVLERFSSAYQPKNIEAVAVGGFSGAHVWRVETVAGVCALRRWPRPGLGRARLLGLHRLLRHIFDAGVTEVAVPIVSLENSSLTELQGSLWQLEPWMPGQADYLAQPSEDRLRAAMSCLAHWHCAAATFNPTNSEAAWFSSHPAAPSPGIAERIERIGYWNPGRLEQAERG